MRMYEVWMRFKDCGFMRFRECFMIGLLTMRINYGSRI